MALIQTHLSRHLVLVQVEDQERGRVECFGGWSPDPRSGVHVQKYQNMHGAPVNGTIDR